MSGFTGIWVAIVTPFRNNAIDFPALEALARHLAGAGVAGLVVCGSTGEAAALDGSEQISALDAVLQAVPECPVVMGLAGNNLPAMLRHLDKIQSRRIAGLLVPPPYYIRPSQSGLLEFFNTIADAALVPVVAYNIPYRTGITLESETLTAIARHDRVVAIKDCGGDHASTLQLIADGLLQVLAGEDQQVFTTLCLGGSGAILASAHIRPDLFVRMTQLIRSGELNEARTIFYRLLPIIRLLFQEPNPGPLKSALAMMGMIRDELRAPMQTASAALREQLAVELKRLECI